MALYKMAKVEVMILTEAGLSDAEIEKWVKNAMLIFCDFDKAVVLIRESHDMVLHDQDDQAHA